MTLLGAYVAPHDASLDPELPDELMRAPRHRARAVALFHRLYAALAGPAQRHFDEVTTAP
jgi:phenylacetic acid degradation operon negative regulatory protein